MKMDENNAVFFKYNKTYDCDCVIFTPDNLKQMRTREKLWWIILSVAIITQKSLMRNCIWKSWKSTPAPSPVPC